jgi:hypothetical protein
MFPQFVRMNPILTRISVRPVELVTLFVSSPGSSHSSQGWQTFTDAVISYLNKEKEKAGYFVLLCRFFFFWFFSHFIQACFHPVGWICAEESEECRRKEALCAQGRTSFPAFSQICMLFLSLLSLYLSISSSHAAYINLAQFLGCKVFSKTNEYLTSTGQRPIDWQLPLTL